MMKSLYSSLLERMAELERAQLVRRANDLEPTYQFKHALIQETIYQSLLKSARTDLHRRVGEVIEQLWPNQVDENAALLAWHYEHAGSMDKAFRYAVLAGDQAARSYGHVEALAYYDLALRIASPLIIQGTAPELKRQFGRLYVQKGRVLEVMGNYDAALTTYRDMLEYSQQIGDTVLEADGLNHLVTAQVVLTGLTEETEEQLQGAFAFAQKIQDPELMARSLWNRGLAYRLTDPKRAADDFAQALELADEASLIQLAGFVRLDLSLTLVLLKRAHQAQPYLIQALDIFRRLDLKPMITDALGTLAYLAYTRAKPATARAFAEEGLKISQTIGNPWGVLYNQMLRFFVFDLEQGHLMRVLEESEDFLIRARQFGYPYFVVMHHAILTRAFLELNQVANAQTWADAIAETYGMNEASALARWARWLQAMVVMRRGELRRAHELLAPLKEATGFPLGPLDFSGWLGQTLAELALLEKTVDEGLMLCDRQIRGFEEEEQFGFAAPMYYWRARLHLAHAAIQQAENDAERASALLDQAENRIMLWRAESLLAEIYAAQGKDAAGRQAYKRAEATLTYVSEHAPVGVAYPPFAK